MGGSFPPAEGMVLYIDKLILREDAPEPFFSNDKRSQIISKNEYTLSKPIDWPLAADDNKNSKRIAIISL